MLGSESLRQTAFWGIDLFRGSCIGKHYRELATVFAEPEKKANLVKERLDRIISHATSTTAFYKKYSDIQNLGQLPVIQKRVIKDNYNEFLSSSFSRNELVTTHTSGSYGMPFTFYLTKNKRARQLAEVIFFNEWAGYKVGMKYTQFRLPHCKKTVFKYSGNIRLFLQNGFLIKPDKIDIAWLEGTRNFLKDKKIKFIIGYPRALLPLAEYCREQGDTAADFHIQGIITGAEPLLQLDRDVFENLFGCIVLDRYSSNELGVISHECRSHKTHHLNLSSHYIEILKMDSDEPAGPGELGRVVVTDYFSDAMPLIRYDTGDTASLSERPCDCGLYGPVFEKIGGRFVENIHSTDGKIIHSMAISHLFTLSQCIVQYQFIQKGQFDYLIKLIVRKDFSDEEALREKLKSLLGEKANLSFEYVDTIEALPSGKRPYIINEYVKNANYDLR